MDTERASPRYSDIDVWAPVDIAEAMIEGQFTAVAAVRAARSALLQAALAAAERLRKGGRLVYVGAGTSGRLAVQDGAGTGSDVQLAPGAVAAAHRGREERAAAVGGRRGGRGRSSCAACSAARASAAMTSSSLSPRVGPRRSPCRARNEAKRRGALTIGVANNRDTPILKEADHAIWLDTGAEPIAGSTRMKAGTAQRITLNVFSSLVMILLGRVYDGLMVDLQAVNQKLVRRSEAILTRLTGPQRRRGARGVTACRGQREARGLAAARL